MALIVLACYDISDDDRRARVAARLQQHGDRLQRSVFICTLPADDLHALVIDVTKLIDVESDSFCVIRQCGGCWTDRVTVGQSHPPAPELYWAVL